MPHPNRMVIPAVCLSLLTLSAQVQSHGERGHNTQKEKSTTHKEQTAWGIAADPKAARRTIEIKMTDTMRFTPSLMEIKQGETVKIVVRNEGKMMHEFVLGTKQVLDEHAALMIKFPTMEHDEPYMAHVPPGKTGEIIWTFNRAGDFDFACLIAGHYQAGMVGKVKVLPAASNPAIKETGRAAH